MPSKKEKQQQQQAALLAMKAQTAALANSTNTISNTTTSNTPVGKTNSTPIVTNTSAPSTKSNANLETVVDRLSLIREQKSELDELNNRFSNYVLALRKRTQENNDLQKVVDQEKQKQKNVSRRDNSDLENQMAQLRQEIDETAVSTEEFLMKRLRALKEVALLKEKIRAEEEQSFSKRRQALETEYQQSVIQLKEFTRRVEDLEKMRSTNQIEMNQLNDLYNRLDQELQDLILNNLRTECNLKTIEEQILLTKAIYETEKSELANEQLKQQQFYTNELDKAIEDIRRDFQTLLKNNQIILENAYTERIEQVKSQFSNVPENSVAAPARVSVANLRDELKEVEKTRDDIENQYRPLIETFINKQKEKTSIDEEQRRLDLEYTRLINEINQITEAIELGKQHGFSVRFELETYRRLLDLQTQNVGFMTTHLLPNGSKEEEEEEHPTTVSIETTTTSSPPVSPPPTTTLTTKKNESQRSISKTGKFDIDQVQAGFISINNAANNCVDQPLKGWTLTRVVNDGEEFSYQFPENYVLKARTRVRVYSNKVDQTGGSNGRLVASAIPAWASTGQGENVKILLLDEKGINRAQYTETWQ